MSVQESQEWAAYSSLCEQTMPATKVLFLCSPRGGHEKLWKIYLHFLFPAICPMLSRLRQSDWIWRRALADDLRGALKRNDRGWKIQNKQTKKKWLFSPRVISIRRHVWCMMATIICRSRFWRCVWLMFNRFWRELGSGGKKEQNSKDPFSCKVKMSSFILESPDLSTPLCQLTCT